MNIRYAVRVHKIGGRPKCVRVCEAPFQGGRIALWRSWS